MHTYELNSRRRPASNSSRLHGSRGQHAGGTRSGQGSAPREVDSERALRTGSVRSLTNLAPWSPAQLLGSQAGVAASVAQQAGQPRWKPRCSCEGTCPTCRNPFGAAGDERSTRYEAPGTTQAPAGGGAAPALPAGGGAAPGPARPGTRPAAHARLASGPHYTPNGSIAATVAGGVKSAGPFDFDAVFASDPANGVFPGCGEIHQDIKWDAAAAASFSALYGSSVPHGGFPATHPANVWIEDRDSANTRYGRRSGPMSAPVAGADEYTNAAGVREMAHGAHYHGNDNPSNWPLALTGKWTFMVLAFDMCNGGVQVGSADFISIDW